MGKRERGKHADPDYLPVKVPKHYANTRKVQNDILCIICNGDDGPLSVEEEKRNIGKKYCNSLVEVSRRHDDVARRSLTLSQLLCFTTSEEFGMFTEDKLLNHKDRDLNNQMV